MTTRIKMKSAVQLAVFLLISCSLAMPAAAAMSDYCQTPPFIMGGVNPNLLLMIDNSASQYDLAYISSGSFSMPTGTCNGSSTIPETFCFDDTYNNSTTYLGYFDNTKTYQYAASLPSSNSTPTANDYFSVYAGSVPASGCTAGNGTEYLCIVGTSTTVTSFIASGNFLNWLATSKLDAQKKILTGGKVTAGKCSVTTTTACTKDGDCPTGETCGGLLLTSESRGCNGRRFVKMVKDSTGAYLNVTFAISGPNAGSTDYYNTVTQGGLSRIEIYMQSMTSAQLAACQCAVLEWTNTTSYGQARTDTRTCLGVTNAQISSYNQILQDCWQLSKNIQGGATTHDEIWQGVSINSDKSQCENVYKDICTNFTTGNDCNRLGLAAGAYKTDFTCNGYLALGGCSNSSKTACTTNADCTGEICIAGMCLKKCNVNADCTAPATCLATNENSGAWQCTGGTLPTPAYPAGTSCGATHLTPTGYYTGGSADTQGFLGNCISSFPGGAGVSTCSYSTLNSCSTDADCSTYLHGTGGSRTAEKCYLGQCGIACTAPDNTDNNCNLDRDPDGSKSRCTQRFGVGWNNSCIEREILHFCYGSQVSEVMDPSSGAADTSTTGNIPSILMDSSVNQFGPPASTLFARVSVASAPTGLINKYSSQMRIGAMTFNQDGSSAECGVSGTYISCPKVCSGDATRQCLANSDCSKLNSSWTCVTGTKTDGGKIISYIGNDPIGDHSGGLIKSIDNIKASSWTPFAESFYTAMGYYARVCSNSTNPASPAACVQDSDCTGATGTSGNGTCISRDFRLQTGTCSVTTSMPCIAGSTSGSGGCPAGETCDTGSTKGDYDLGKNPSQFKCQKNNVLIITDGMSTADKNTAANNLASLYYYGASNVTGYDTTNLCPQFAGSRSIDDLASLAYNWNIKTFSTTSKTSKTCSGSGTACTSNADCSSAQTCLNSPQNASEYINTYVVYGGKATSPYTGSATAAQCDPLTVMNATAAAGGTGSAFTATDPATLQSAIDQALSMIAAKSASGTAASVLASGEGSGANLIQAVFYPTRKFGGTDVTWTGVMQNLWYYLDPALNNSTIREDSNGDKTFRLSQDKIINFVFNTSTNQTEVNLYADANADGIKDSSTPSSTIPFDSLSYLWETGKLLFQKSPANRTIYTNLSADNTQPLSFTSFTTGNASALRSKLDVSDDTNATNLINYTRGTDSSTLTVDGKNLRNRTVTIGGVTNTWKLGDIISSTPKIISSIPINNYHKKAFYNDQTYYGYIRSSSYVSRGAVFSGGNDGMLHAYRLGKLTVYNESDRKAALQRTCSTTMTTVCASDGDCPSGETCGVLGDEMWAFIPKHSLPYLKYLADPNYCHLYYIDLTPYVFDASIGRDTSVTQPSTCVDYYAGYPGTPSGPSSPNALTTDGYWNCNKTTDSWRTIIIGGMRLGGACKNSGTSCSECVTTPVADLGYSSYFALDVTNPSNPILLWEFSNPGLGYSTSGPVIIKVNPKNGDTNGDGIVNGLDSPAAGKNGRWMVVFGSGPTGYISSKQFLGTAEHGLPNAVTNAGNIKLFVVDMKTGALLRTINGGDSSAFVGSLVNSSFDADLDYQDDAFYFGYTSRSGFTDTDTASGSGTSGTLNTIQLSGSASSTDQYYKGSFIHLSSTHETKLITDYVGSTKIATIDSNWKLTPPSSGTGYNILPGWTIGGVKRAMTKESMDPADWAVSSVIDGIGPVTSAVTKVQDPKEYTRLYFGSGRFFYRISDIIDDANSQRRLFGIKEPCVSGETVDPSCTTTVPFSSLSEAATSSGSTDTDGWYINLDICTDSSGAVPAAVCSNATSTTCSSDWDCPGGRCGVCYNPTVVYKSERVISDPLASVYGYVYFVSTRPSADVCSYGGASNLWAVAYKTGGQVPAGTLKGKVTIQLSTGSIEEIDVSSAFTQREGRRTANFTGQPPQQQPQASGPPAAVNTILHIRKK